MTSAPAVITLRVNGAEREVHTEPDTSLLTALRNHLGLTGARFGCGLSLCGSCTVLVDGDPVYACDTPVWSVRGRAITTVEGLAGPDRPHAVQRAFIAEQAAQCGYCVSGIVLRAAALLEREPQPDEARVREALDPSLCRCGAHNRMVRAVLRAAEDRDG
ncbi:MAG TPA: (2Fe-2S)-binding protein [Pseudonocardiaceae bacterium]|nr:(2Fe-2S)-binding protein [Pseudonocardiaceae bacterium]